MLHRLVSIRVNSCSLYIRLIVILQGISPKDKKKYQSLVSVSVAFLTAGSRMSEVDVYKSRLERTVKIQLSSEGRSYSRKDVLDRLLGAGVPRKPIEALGVRERNVKWEVTLCTADRNCLLQLLSPAYRRLAVAKFSKLTM